MSVIDEVIPETCHSH